MKAIVRGAEDPKGKERLTRARGYGELNEGAEALRREL